MTNEPTAAPEVRDTTDQYHDSIVEQRGYDRAVRDVLAYIRQCEAAATNRRQWKVSTEFHRLRCSIQDGDHRPKGNA